MNTKKNFAVNLTLVIPVLLHYTVWWLEAWLYSFLIEQLDEAEWSASFSARLILRERAPSTHWLEKLVGPRADLDSSETR